MYLSLLWERQQVMRAYPDVIIPTIYKDARDNDSLQCLQANVEAGDVTPVL